MVLHSGVISQFPSGRLVCHQIPVNHASCQEKASAGANCHVVITCRGPTWPVHPDSPLLLHPCRVFPHTLCFGGASAEIVFFGNKISTLPDFPRPKLFAGHAKST
jgi:hypothetical protein